MAQQQLTTANKILVSAAQLDTEKDTFTAEDLIVRSWNVYPESFGLTGYAERFPDSNRVLAKLMGAVGLCNRGWLEQVSTKTYRMTPSGRKYAQSLVSGEKPEVRDIKSARSAKEAAPKEKPSPREDREVEAREPPPRRVKKEAAAERVLITPKSERSAPARPTREAPAAVSARASNVPPRSSAAERDEEDEEDDARDEEEEKPLAEARPARNTPAAAAAAPAVAVDSSKPFDGIITLTRLVTSLANQKWARGAMVTFADACQFWGITAGVHPAHLQPRLAEVDAVLKRAQAYIQATAAAIRVNDRVDVTLSTVIGLQALHRTMLQKYHREVETIRGRGEDK